MTKNTITSDIAVIKNDISTIKEDVKEINVKLEKDYVSRQEFDPIRKIVYGMVTLILVAVVTALIKLVLLP